MIFSDLEKQIRNNEALPDIDKQIDIYIVVNRMRQLENRYFNVFEYWEQSWGERKPDKEEKLLWIFKYLLILDNSNWINQSVEIYLIAI